MTEQALDTHIVSPETSVSRSQLRLVAGNFLRGIALTVCLLTLLLARYNIPFEALVILVILSLATLYFVDRRSDRFGVWVAYMLGFILFALLRTRADDLGVRVRAGYSVHAEEWLFGGALPGHWLQARLYQPGSVTPLAVFGFAVVFSYYVVPHLVALGLWRRNFDQFKRFALAVVITVYTGLVVAAIVPTAPPWLAAHYTNAPRVYRIDALLLHWNPERVGSSGSTPGVNPVAAMPSLHFALTALIVVALWQHRYLRLFAFLYLAAMGFSLVFMGEHYVIDILAGTIVAAIAWAMASRIVRVKVEDETLPTVASTPDATVERAA